MESPQSSPACARIPFRPRVPLEEPRFRMRVPHHEMQQDSLSLKQFCGGAYSFPPPSLVPSPQVERDEAVRFAWRDLSCFRAGGSGLRMLGFCFRCYRDCCKRDCCVAAVEINAGDGGGERRMTMTMRTRRKGGIEGEQGGASGHCGGVQSLIRARAG